MVRVATEADKVDIVELLRHAPYRHIHSDWRLPVDWLGEKSFVVIPKTPLPHTLESVTAKLFSQRSLLLGCLAATADDSPAAWVRAVALDYIEQPEVALGKMLAEVEAYLGQTAVTELAWLIVDGWPMAWLPNFGFQQVNEIETYMKDDLTLPPIRSVPDLIIRPAGMDDMPGLARLEKAAFGPLWRHSLSSLRLAYSQTISFTVAIWRNQLVGFQFSTTARRRGAHLSRMTVDPDMQGLGIGSALLAHAIGEYKQQGVQYVSLNTQIDNFPSLKLYRKFNFEPTNDRLPVMVKSISS
jgi:ribosomal protein S18 acetylase RimI-like enzyme